MPLLPSRSPSRIAVVLTAVLLAPCGAPAQTPDEPAFARPSYQFLRFNEDWSVLAGMPEDAPADLWDPIKYVPLNDDGSVWASFGGHARLRFEDWSNFSFGAPENDDDSFLLWRVTLHADVHVGKSLRGFIEGKSTGSTDRDLPGGRRTLDVDSLDLEQAFIDLDIPLGDKAKLVLRPGRQTFLFGKQRLVSPLPWANTMRRWDGVSGRLTTHGWTLTGFWSQFAPVRKYEFNDPDSGREFYGLYANTPLEPLGGGLDLYFLGLDRDSIGFNGTAGDEERYTVGGRLYGRSGAANLDYDIEGAYQFGEVGRGDVDAFMVTGDLGYTVPQWWSGPRFFIGSGYASGDRSAGGDVETFNQLFPLGHAYLGFMDFVGRQNVIDLHAGVSGNPLDKLTVGLTGHLFWRADDADALYNAGGGVVRPGAPGTDREVGSEIDLTFKYRMDRHIAWLFGYSHFFAGDFIEETGSDDDMDFVYVQMQYTF